MSGRHVMYVLSLDLKWNHKSVLLLVAFSFDETKGYAWRSIGTYAEITKKDPRQIRRWLRRPELENEIRVEEGRGAGNYTRIYFRNVPWPNTKEDKKEDKKGDKSASAIRKKGENKERKKGGNDSAPTPDLNSYARHVLNFVELPSTSGNETAVSEALKCEIRRGKTPEQARDYILDGCKAARPTCEINRFFFEDAKYQKFAERELQAEVAALPAAQPHIDFHPDAAVDSFLAAHPKFWELVLYELKTKIQPRNYETWIRPLRYAGVDGSCLVLYAPHSGWPTMGHKEIIETCRSMGIPLTGIRLLPRTEDSDRTEHASQSRMRRPPQRAVNQ